MFVFTVYNNFIARVFEIFKMNNIFVLVISIWHIIITKFVSADHNISIRINITKHYNIIK